MNESELIERVAQRAGVSRPMAKEYIDALKAVIADEVATGGCVRLCGLGEFHVKRYPPRTLRNPQTGKLIDVGERRVPAFCVARAWKTALNEPATDPPAA